MNFDEDLVNEFIAEGKEHLGTIEEDFLTLEKQPDAPDPKLVDKVFRAIHSIKGAAGFLGLTRMAELAHVMETLLDMLRSGRIRPEPRYLDGLLAGVDLLNAMLDSVDTSNAMDIGAVHARISDLIAAAASPQTREAMEARVPLADDSGRPVTFDISRFTLDALPETHKFLYLLKYDLSAMARKGGPSPVALIRDLLGTGEILDARVETCLDDFYGDLSQATLVYEVLYATVLEHPLAAAAANLPEELVVPVRRETHAAGTADAAPPAPAGAHGSRCDPVADAAPDGVPAAPAVAPDGVHDSAAAGRRPARTEKAAGKEHAEYLRVSVEILDRLMRLAGELVLVRNQHLMSAAGSDGAARGIAQRLDVVTSELQETIMRTRMQPVGRVFNKLPRITRDLGKKLGKRIEIELAGGDVELDKTILESLADPLTHIVRNCCDHGIEAPEARAAAGKDETGKVLVRAYHEGGQMNIQVIDDGKGIDTDAVRRKALEKGLKAEGELARMTEKELSALVALPGFSTAETVSDVSGRGVGMDVVRSGIEKLSGSLEIASTRGRGTTIHLRLPLTLAIIPCLIVQVGEHLYAIPQVNLEELVCLYDADVRARIECVNEYEVYRLRDTLLPMVRMDEVLARCEPFTPKVCAQVSQARRRAQEALENAEGQRLNFAVVKVGAERFGLIVDRVLGTEEIVVKPMHPSVKRIAIYSGATVLGDGRAALILDIEGIARHAGVRFGAGRGRARVERPAAGAEDTQSVLIFRHGDAEQFAVSLPLIRRIERVDMRGVDRVGDKEFITLEGRSTYILRLDRLIKVSPCVMRDEMFMLIPKHAARPVGILVSSLVDIGTAPLELDTKSCVEDGILGSAILGTTMTLFLDIFRLIERTQPDGFAARRRKTPPPGERKRILLVEDAGFFRHLVKGYLEADDYDVVTAANGQEALERAAASTFDLILSDLEMPVMNGWEFARALRADTRHSGVPIIALTALDTAQARARAHEAGFDGYKVKLDREDLLADVAHILQGAAGGNR